MDSSTTYLCFDDIPVEVQLKIFSYLDSLTLLHSVSLVSKKWNQRAFDPIFWRHLTLSSDVERETLMKLLERCTLLSYLSFRGSNNADVLSEYTQSLANLKELDIGFSEHTAEKDICCILKSCPKLEKLNVEGCVFFNDSCITELINLKNLMTLNIAHCKFITNNGIIMIGEHCKKLGNLGIDGITQITDSAVISMCSNLCNTLTKLKLDGEDLTDKSFCSVKKCQNLELLAIPFAESLTDEGLACIQELKNLRWLQIHRATIVSNLGMANFFTITSHKNLVYLDISTPQMDDAAISNMTDSCPLLHSLLLCWCWDITEVGLNVIISKLSNLFHLDLTGLFQINGQCLVEIPVKLPHLRFLNLQQCNNIVDSLLPGIILEADDLVIINYYGDIVKQLDLTEST